MESAMAINAVPSPGDPARIKVAERAQSKFEVLRLLNSYAVAVGGSVQAGENPSFWQGLSAAAQAASNDPKMLHGQRVERMFGYVAAAMGECVVVKAEDSGPLYFESENFEIPDYRVITRDGWEGLIEIKNHHADFAKPYRIDVGYLRKLERYAQLMKKPLLFAIYWSRMAIWCLVSPAVLKVNGLKAEVSFSEAFKENQLGRLGDVTISTLPPLEFRLIADREKARTVGANGDTPFTIADVELTCRGQVLNGKEAKIAWFLIHNGEWVEKDVVADVQDGLLNSATFSFGPEEENLSDLPFRRIGTLSRIISLQYNRSTTKDGKVVLLNPRERPSDLGVIIPRDYSSESLPLWRLSQRPASGNFS